MLINVHMPHALYDENLLTMKHCSSDSNYSIAKPYTSFRDLHCTALRSV